MIGVTMICSMVPISFSRTTAMLVNSSVTSADDDHDHAGHEEVAAFQVLVEPGPGAQFERGRSCPPDPPRARRAPSGSARE